MSIFFLAESKKKFSGLLVLALLCFVQLAKSESLPAPKLTAIGKGCVLNADKDTPCKKQGLFSKSYQLKTLKKLLRGTSKPDSEIFIGTFTFTNPYVKEIYCNSDTPNQKIILAVDHTFSSDAALEAFSKKCTTSREHSIEIISPVKKKNEEKYRIHHAKMIFATSKMSDYATIIFGSANLTLLTLSAHYDYWNSLTVLKTSQFALQHRCYMQAIKSTSASTSADDKALFSKALSQCRTEMNLKPFDNALEKEGIAPIFVPEKEKSISKLLIKEIRKLRSGETLKMATQLISSKILTFEMIKAAKRGVRVELILEDDILTGANHSAHSKVFFEEQLKGQPLHFKFIKTDETKHHFFHMKYILIGNRLLVTGSGQFTYSGFNAHYENFYASINSQSIKEFQKLHNRLWELGYTSDTSSQQSRFWKNVTQFWRVLF